MKIIKKIIISLLFIVLFSFNMKILAYEEVAIDITKMDISDIQNAIDKKILTYEKLVKLYLDRIKEYDTKYNSIISINENAINQAINCDKIYQENGRTSMLFGIPIILKDNIDYTELPTTGGTKALSDSYPKTNSTIVQNLLNAGAIIIAKANMSEFAFSARISQSSYGTVKNAYNTSYTTYGSSGGCATSTAASFSTASIGTDTNSSIRLPASCSNLVGLRPTYGLLDLNGIINYDFTRDTPGPITKNVSDNAILLTALSNNNIDYTQYLKKDGLNGKRIGVLNDFLINSYDQIKLLFDNTRKKMTSAGATIVDIDNFYKSTYDNYNSSSVLGITMAYRFNQYIKNTTSKIKSFSDLLKNGGFIQDLYSYNYYTNVDYTQTADMDIKNKTKETYKKIISDLMDEYNLDALIYPTSSNELLKIDDTDSSAFYNNSSKISPTIGYPSINIPLGFDSNSLPYGFEIVARPNKEDTLYEIAYSYEQLDYNLKTPDNVSPNLYTIDESTKNLIDTYSNNIGKYEDIDELSRSFFENYQNIENKELQAQEIISKYNDAIEKENVASTFSNIDNSVPIDNNNNNSNINYIDIILLIACGLILLIIIRYFKKQKKVKKRKYKNKPKSYSNKKNNAYIKKFLEQNDNNKF